MKLQCSKYSTVQGTKQTKQYVIIRSHDSRIGFCKLLALSF